LLTFDVDSDRRKDVRDAYEKGVLTFDVDSDRRKDVRDAY
jgi:hypothetical protein